MIRLDIQKLLAPVVCELGCELWACEYLSHSKNPVLRIYIDKTQSAIDIADCEAVSRRVSAILDVEDIIHGAYALEVSSPGVPRPLFIPEHYVRYIGFEVLCKLYQPINGSKKICGKICEVNDKAFLIQCDDIKHELQFSQVVKANLIDG